MIEALTRPVSADAPTILEADIIIDMLSYLDEYPDPANGEILTRFSCKRFDGRKCSKYDERPQMCARYPDYGVGKDCRLCSISVEASGIGVPWPDTAETGIFSIEN